MWQNRLHPCAVFTATSGEFAHIIRRKSARIWLLVSFGEMGWFGDLAPFSCPQARRKTRVVSEKRSLHFPRGGSRALHFTKYGQEPECKRNPGDVIKPTPR